VKKSFVASIGLIVTFSAHPAVAGECLSEAPGTYELLVCKGPCSFESSTNIVVKGVLVLTAANFEPDALNPFVPEPFEYAYSFNDDPNGCFVVDTLVQNKTYAGIIELGMTHWSDYADQIRFSLYTSPDAWHHVTATLTHDGLAGTGGSSGAGVAAPGYDRDIIIARRVGPPNLDRCVEAAWVRQQKRRHAT